MARSGKSTAPTALRASWDRFPAFAGWAKLWRPLARENASEVPVLPAEKQISDFARNDNATGAERRGIQGIEIGTKILLRSLHFAAAKGADAPVGMTIFI